MPAANPIRRFTAAAPIAAVVFGAICTATNPVFVRLSELDPSASAFHRMFWALPLLFVWTRAERGRAPAPPLARRDVFLLVLCGLFFAGDLIALHASIELTAAANAILFLNAQPIYVVLASWLLFGERVSARFVLAMTAAIAGAGGLVWSGAAAGTGNLEGDLLGVLAGIFYAGYILTASRLRGRLSSAVINAWTCAAGAPVLLAVALVSVDRLLPSSAQGWGLMLALGMFSHALGQGLIVWGLAHVPTSFSSVALLVAPVAAAVFAWMFLGEALMAGQWISMMVVLVAIQMAWMASKPGPAAGASKD